MGAHRAKSKDTDLTVLSDSDTQNLSASDMSESDLDSKCNFSETKLPRKSTFSKLCYQGNLLKTLFSVVFSTFLCACSLGEWRFFWASRFSETLTHFGDWLKK